METSGLTRIQIQVSTRLLPKYCRFITLLASVTPPNVVKIGQ